MSIAIESQEAAATKPAAKTSIRGTVSPVKFVLNGQGHILNAEVAAQSTTDVERLADFIETHNRKMRVRAANSL